MTNGDKIRNMTDEELAFVLMCPYDFADHWYIYQEKPNCDNLNCADCTRLWLESEADE